MLVQIHTRTCYSLLDSMIKIESLVEKAKLFDYNSLVITDKNVMHGYLKFYNLCKNNNIKPVFGLEVTININDLDYSIYLYAKNDDGFYNLSKLSSFISLGNIVTLDNINEFSDNCIVIVPSIDFYFSNIRDNVLLAEELNKINHKFTNLYIGIVNNDVKYNFEYNTLVKECCKTIGIKTIAFNEVFYLEKDDAYAYKILQGIKQQKTISSNELIQINGRFFRSPYELQELYEEEDLNNIKKLILECNVNLNLKKTTLPKYITKNNVDSKIYLRKLCEYGLEKRLNYQVSRNYIDRLNHELNVITNMNFEDYFLIVYDFILFAKKNKIYVGPGRGSAAGSLVAYCLGITHLDPIKYGLLFERFLNPERISMPDIDTDFPDNRREEVIDYVSKKYGEDHVSHIITFGTMKAKQVIRDVARVLEFNNYDVDKLAKAIPNDLKVTLSSAYNNSDKFRTVLNSDIKYKELFDLSKKLEGLPRHYSTHAAGLVISKDNLTDIIPCIKLDEMLTTQFTMEYLEDLGLIKMDFLGLRNLTIIDEIVQNIRKDDNDFDIMKIPLNDDLTYNLIQKCDVLGVFQLESMGMKSLVKKVKPQSLNDIALTLALYRPGPMQNIPLFLSNRSNPNHIVYPHNDLKDILEETSGIIIYQEQIMNIAQKMAGFTLGKADILRKAMSKKKIEQLMSLKDDFIKGCMANNYSQEISLEIYELILKFANYGFNKSHSVAYGLIAYQMAYLKANYQLYFYESLLNSVISSFDKTSEYINECKRSKTKILGLSINKSEMYYTIENEAIRFPLLAIKGLGFNSLKTIIDERINKGEYKNYSDFVLRMVHLNISKKIILAMGSKAGLVKFKYSRISMLASLDENIVYANLANNDGQMSIGLDILPKPKMIIVKEDAFDRAERERDVLGFYLSSNPIVFKREQYKFNFEYLINLKKLKGYVTGFGVIKKIKTHRTKRNELMAFVSIQDETSDFDLAIMPDLLKKYEKVIKKGNYIVFNGKIGDRNSCLVKEIKIVE